MGNQDWGQLGNEIKDMVQDAVNSQDFSKLNQGINRVVNGAMDNLGNLLGGRQPGGYWEIRDDGKPRPGQYRPGGTKPGQPPYRQPGGLGGAGGKNYGNQQAASVPGQRVGRPEKNAPIPPGPYKNPSGMSVAGHILAILGGIVTAGTGVALLICLIVTFFAPSLSRPVSAGLNIANGILFILTAMFGVACWGGVRKIGLAKRFRQYVKCIRGRGYCQLEELAKSTGKTESFIKKDVKRMLGKGLFLEGHLDRQETCLITTNQAYDQYKAAQSQLEERQQQEKISREQAKGKAQGQGQQGGQKVSSEIQKMLDEGNEFLVHIRKCNDLIPGEEISGKISKMERIVQNIFMRAQAHPEVAPDLRKMMDYYLPTTVKLLDAYAELDAQPVQGENITNSKREIEQVLDTLNQAFEKLLDSIFQDTAWDLSTDISVLQTLLAQEGLVGDDFKMKEGLGEEK